MEKGKHHMSRHVSQTVMASFCRYPGVLTILRPDTDTTVEYQGFDGLKPQENYGTYAKVISSVN